MQKSERLNKIPPYLFAEIDKKIAAAKAKGIDVISLGIGDPDKPTIPSVIKEMHIAVDNAKNHDYPPYEGTLQFREASSKWLKERFGIDINPKDEIISSIGSKEAIAHLFLAFVDAGDYTLIPDPGYPVYRTGTIFAGGTPYAMPLLEENGFLPDFDKIPEDIAKKSKIMFLNYPNNPTGAVCDLEFFKKAVDFCKKYDILLCHDNAYCEITYDGFKAPSVLEVEGAKDIAIEFFSHSKSYNMTGWRLGFVCGNKEAIQALGTIKNNLDSGTFKAIQQAGIKAYNAPEGEVLSLISMYQERKDVIENGLKELGWPVEQNKSKGTIFLWHKVPNGMTSEEFATLMLEKAAVVVPAGIGYGKYGEGYFRIALTQETERLKEVIQRMKDAGIKFQ